VLLAPQNILDGEAVRRVLEGETQAPLPGLPQAEALATGQSFADTPQAGVRHYRQAQPDDLARIEAALASSGGNKSRAAQQLGMTLRQFNYRLARLRGA
jgi:Nif-specific regulatory protein